MNFDLTFRSQAKHDLEEIETYYNLISEKLINRFFVELYEAIKYIQYNPELYQVRYRDVRIAFLFRFPYGIHYKIKLKTVIVYRILHTSRYFK